MKNGTCIMNSQEIRDFVYERPSLTFVVIIEATTNSYDIIDFGSNIVTWND